MPQALDPDMFATCETAASPVRIGRSLLEPTAACCAWSERQLPAMLDARRRSANG
jgi:hypothetical protein